MESRRGIRRRWPVEGLVKLTRLGSGREKLMLERCVQQPINEKAMRRFEGRRAYEELLECRRTKARGAPTRSATRGLADVD